MSTAAQCLDAALLPRTQLLYSSSPTHRPISLPFWDRISYPKNKLIAAAILYSRRSTFTYIFYELVATDTNATTQVIDTTNTTYILVVLPTVELRIATKQYESMFESQLKMLAAAQRILE